MATPAMPALGGQIPFSNRAGNNQFSGGGTPKATPQMPVGGFPGSTIAPGNPYSPVGGAIPRAFDSTGGGSTSAPNPLGLNPSSSTSQPGTVGSLDKQLVDIWGKGVGGALANLLQNMSGTDSQVLQQYIASLQPQMAKASANVSASLGAGGVSANSSVNAIAQGDLQAQETASIAGESAKLTMSQEDLTAQILQSMMNPASKEVATSGWSTFADVMNNITGDVGNLLGGSYTSPEASGAPSAGGFSAPQLNFGGAAPDASGVQSAADSLSGSGSMDLSSFGVGDTIPAGVEI